MTKHKKLALFLAPLLTILGFIIADYYQEHQASQEKIFPLNLIDNCDVLTGKCILSSGELKIRVSHQNGITEINSTFPLDQVTLFLVTPAEVATKANAIPYPATMNKNQYYWRSKTPLTTLIEQNSGQYQLRLITKIKGGWYIAEFITRSITD